MGWRKGKSCRSFVVLVGRVRVLSFPYCWLWTVNWRKEERKKEGRWRKWCEWDHCSDQWVADLITLFLPPTISFVQRLFSLLLPIPFLLPLPQVLSLSYRFLFYILLGFPSASLFSLIRRRSQFITHNWIRFLSNWINLIQFQLTGRWRLYEQ